MSTILPKGIVVNSPGISGDIERRDREPLTSAEIAKFWRVYTTTKRRLLDPTAERLENLWWRIWGSRKRSLEGAKVAILFSEISDGQTFVPLRGPANRYEASDTVKKSPGQSQEASSSTNIYNETEAEGDADSSGTRVSSITSKNPTAIMPPPILKKSRGPSASGPRPTARFVSPHSSEDEAATNSNSTNSGNSHVVVRPPTPPSPELVTSPTDAKVVASSSRRKISAFSAVNAGHKRKLGTTRRRSSQSSTSSEASLRTRISGLKKEQWDGALPETPEEPVALAKNQKSSKLVETLSPFAERRNGVRAGKNVDVTKGTEYVGRLAGKKTSHKLLVPRERHFIEQEQAACFGESGTSGSQRSINAKVVRRKDNIVEDAKSCEYASHDGPNSESAMRLTEPRACQPQVDSGQSETVTDVSQVPHEDLSLVTDGDHVQVRNLAALHHFAKKDAKSTISVAPAYAAATGQIEFMESLPISGPSKDIKDEDADFTAPKESKSDLFAKRPVQSLTKAASALFDGSSAGRTSTETPMSRSKSQLTLLLEKDKAKSKQQKVNEGPLSPKSPKSKESKPMNSTSRKG